MNYYIGSWNGPKPALEKEDGKYPKFYKFTVSGETEHEAKIRYLTTLDDRLEHNPTNLSLVQLEKLEADKA